MMPRIKGKLKGKGIWFELAAAICTILGTWADAKVGDMEAIQYIGSAVWAALAAWRTFSRPAAAPATPTTPTAPTPPIPPVAPLVLLCVLLMPLAFGCSFLAPGGDTRTAAEARSTTSWDAESNLRLEENTTHNRRVLMAEGDGVGVEYQKDGTPAKVTGATQVLSQCSEPHDVMQGYMLLAQKNAEVAAGMLNALQQIATLYQPVLIQRQQQQGARAEGNAASAVATAEGIALLRDLLAEVGVLPEVARTPAPGTSPTPGAPPAATEDPAVAAIKAAIARIREQKATTQGAP